jgi:hypothetical protein
VQFASKAAVRFFPVSEIAAAWQLQVFESIWKFIAHLDRCCGGVGRFSGVENRRQDEI